MIRGSDVDAGVGDAAFSSVEGRAWLHVGKVTLNTTSSQIRAHLSGKFPKEDFEIEALPKRDDARSLSFKVGARFSLLEDLNRPEIWPAGVLIRRFKFFRKTGASASSGSRE